ncbi:acetyl-CoA decarbonylase/synthase complex subunit gamma [Methanofollis formosanus]|nr:acetyl-CoA decarbonylase/synthase complex subunit gamma [Methanofollis formosanus]
MKALEVYKLLPKTNCKECGFPTCLAFAMKLAAGGVEPERCPYLDEETKALLGGATRPPVRAVTVGVGARSFTVGEEIVMFRHEKTFYHRPGIMVCAADTSPVAEIRRTAEEVRDFVVHRVGQDLTLDGIALRCESGDPDRFAAAAMAVGECGDLPRLLIAADPAAHEAALRVCGQFLPLIHAATTENHAEMAALAKRYGCPLVVRAETQVKLADLAAQCTAAGAPAVLLDPAPRTMGDFVARASHLREHAVTRAAPDLGYPLYLDTVPLGTDAALAAGILRYAGVIAVPPLPHPSLLAALTLRQNIYTDPQKPIQVAPGIYPVNNPGRDAPVLLSVNFSLTYFTLLGYLEAAKVPCYLFVVDTAGLSVLTAVAGGKLDEEVVKKAIEATDLAGTVGHRTIVIPGFAAPLSGRIEEATGWTVRVGPRDAAEIGEFLETETEG